MGETMNIYVINVEDNRANLRIKDCVLYVLPAWRNKKIEFYYAHVRQDDPSDYNTDPNARCGVWTDSIRLKADSLVGAVMEALGATFSTWNKKEFRLPR